LPETIEGGYYDRKRARRARHCKPSSAGWRMPVRPRASSDAMIARCRASRGQEFKRCRSSKSRYPGRWSPFWHETAKLAGATPLGYFGGNPPRTPGPNAQLRQLAVRRRMLPMEKSSRKEAFHALIAPGQRLGAMIMMRYHGGKFESQALVSKNMFRAVDRDSVVRHSAPESQ